MHKISVKRKIDSISLNEISLLPVRLIYSTTYIVLCIMIISTLEILGAVAGFGIKLMLRSQNPLQQ